jgi:glycosyltransferase involved in cell wall biosynthesis
VRIALAAHALPPRSTAGVEVYTLRLAQALRARGHEILLLAAAHDLAAAPFSLRRRELEGLAVAEVVNVHHKGTLEATYDEPELAAPLVRALSEFRPDVLHAQHLLNLSVALPRLAREAGAAVVMTLHDYWPSCPRDGLRMREDLATCGEIELTTCARCLASSPYLTPPLQRGIAGAARRAGLGRHLHRIHDLFPRTTERALRLARRMRPASHGLVEALARRREAIRAALGSVDVFLAPTAFAVERALEFGLPASRVRRWPLGAVPWEPLERPARARRRLAYFGTLAPHKGVHVLIEAIARMRAGDLTLDVHGSTATHPGYAEKLRRAAARDDRIRFRGPYAEGEQRRLLAEVDAVVLPSLWWENSPMVVLEALAAGVPVIASATGGVPELVSDGISGLLVPPGDRQRLQDALWAVASGRALAGTLPPLPIRTVGEEARAIEELYTAHAMRSGAAAAVLR